MRSKLLIPLLCFALAACMPTPTPADSGIRGLVTLGPTCPVVQLSDPCPDKPYQATLDVLSADGQRRVLEFQTDASGVFQVRLAPGAYILHPGSPQVMPHARDVPFTVQAHQFTQVDVSYDSGIR
jgi:hypothetical protein